VIVWTLAACAVAGALALRPKASSLDAAPR
jgi:hypothetical protein